MKVYINGEPDFPKKDLGDEEIDVFLSSTLVPGRDDIFYADFLWNENSEIATTKPLIDRDIDILYRSSRCKGKVGEKRHSMVEVIAEKAEAAGLNFVSSGKCETKHGKNIRSSSKKMQDWARCDECTDSKIILAFERFDEGHPYLSEKANLAFQHGAVPAYHGNGTQIMENIIGIDSQSYLNLSDLNAEDAANAVVQSIDNIGDFNFKKRNDAYAKQIEAIRSYTCDLVPDKNDLTVKFDYHYLNKNQISDLENLLCLENKTLTYLRGNANKRRADVIISGNLN